MVARSRCRGSYSRRVAFSAEVTLSLNDKKGKDLHSVLFGDNAGFNLGYVAGGVVLTGREPAAFLVRVT